MKGIQDFSEGWLALHALHQPLSCPHHVLLS